MHYWCPRRREKGAENLFEEIMAENVSNIGKETDIRVQAAQRIPNTMNLKRDSRHITINMSKSKEKILKAAKQKQLLAYNGTPIRL